MGGIIGVLNRLVDILSNKKILKESEYRELKEELEDMSRVLSRLVKKFEKVEGKHGKK
jgi:hypothetical protein